MNKLGSPAFFYQVLNNAKWPLIIATSLFMGYGLIAGLFFAPIDYQQKEAVKLIYIHVPCAILSMSIYTIIGINSFIYLIWRIKVADIIATVSAPLGASCTALALISGALWGKPMWGTWWVWDARLTSELILFFLYCGYLGLRNAILEPKVRAFACAILALIGLIDIPIIHYSVQWWHTLHQGATIGKFAKPSIDPSMLYPLLSMIIACYCWYALVICFSASAEVLWRERNTTWVRDLVLGKS